MRCRVRWRLHRRDAGPRRRRSGIRSAHTTMYTNNRRRWPFIPPCLASVVDVAVSGMLKSCAVAGALQAAKTRAGMVPSCAKTLTRVHPHAFMASTPMEAQPAWRAHAAVVPSRRPGFCVGKSGALENSRRAGVSCRAEVATEQVLELLGCLLCKFLSA